MKVSILIPVHNSEEYLESALKSVLAQSWEDIEVIIVDDGSTDNSLGIARKYQSSKVKVFSQQKSGACAARNRAFKESSGAYIQYLDADDLLSPGKIEYQMNNISAEKPNSVFSSRYLRFMSAKELPSVSSKYGILDRSWENPVEWLINSWLGRGMGQTAIWLTPRRLIEKAGPWNESLSINQDGEFFCRVLLHAQNIVFSEGALVYYRSGNQNSISQRISAGKVEDLLRSYQLCEQHVLAKVDNSEVRKAIGRCYCDIIYTYQTQHPEVAKKARQYLSRLGKLKYPVPGGKYFRALSGLLGYNYAIWIRSAVQKVLQRSLLHKKHNKNQQ